MHYRVIALIYFIFFYKCAFSQAVFSFRLDTTTTVTKVGAPLKMPFAGGLNSPVFCQIDLNGDGHNDLLVLDRVGNRLSTFLFNPSSINLKYDYL